MGRQAETRLFIQPTTKPTIVRKVKEGGGRRTEKMESTIVMGSRKGG
jgi:hypothetical protein